jgi:hypothetical protein
MKTFSATIILSLISALASAATPSDQTAKVVRALVNNPNIVSQLKASGADHLTDLQIKETKPGIFQYNLVFERICHCAPLKSTVRILEDVTPTYADGLIKYESSISAGPEATRNSKPKK